MGGKLQALVGFDAPSSTKPISPGVVVAAHVAGAASEKFVGAEFRLEQKAHGWVAANNQALCNLPHFPDFLNAKNPAGISKYPLSLL